MLIGRNTVDKKDILYCEGGEALAQAAQRSCGCSSLAGFKAMLDGALSTLGWWKGSLPMAGGWNEVDLQGPFQPKPFCDSMKISSENTPKQFLQNIIQLQ